MHGGKSSGPTDQTGNTNAVTHGFYTDALQPAERQLWERVQIGSIDDEIRLLRVKLHRLVRMSGSAEMAELIDSAIEVAQKHDTNERIGKFDKTEIKVKAPLYGELIIQALEQLRKLELTRMQMQLAKQKLEEGGGGDVDDIERTDTFLAPDGDVPAKPIL